VIDYIIEQKEVYIYRWVVVVVVVVVVALSLSFCTRSTSSFGYMGFDERAGV